MSVRKGQFKANSVQLDQELGLHLAKVKPRFSSQIQAELKFTPKNTTVMGEAVLALFFVCKISKL